MFQKEVEDPGVGVAGTVTGAANGRLLTTPQPPFLQGFELPLFSPMAPSVEATPHLQPHPTALVLLSFDLGVLSFRLHLR